MTQGHALRLAGTREVIATAAVCGALLLIALVVSFIGATAMQASAANGFVLLVLVIGLGVFVGSTGVLSFGHASFAAIAGYISALLTIPEALKLKLVPDLPHWLSATVLPLPISIFIAVVVATLIGICAGFAIVRLTGASAAIATLGLLIIANSVLIGASDYTRGAQALYGIPGSIGLWASAFAACAAFIVARCFKDSSYGLLSRAARDDEVSARSIGISLHSARMIPWVLSVAIVALGGALLAHRLTVISPKEFYFAQSFEWLVVLIIGGMLSVSGNILGAAAIVVLIEMLRRIEEGVSIFGVTTPQIFGLTDAGLSLAILFTLIKRGEGIAGTTEFDQLPVFRRWPSLLSALAPGTVLRSAPVEPSKGALKVDKLSKSFGGVQALSDVSFEIEPATIVGLIGPNGSGKSTLLGCVSGVLKTTSGTVSIAGRVLTGSSPEAIVRQGLARTFQNIRLFQNLTSVENVEAALIGSGSTRSRASSRLEAFAILRQTGLENVADRKATTLSYGDQRRLEIARALACSPRFLLLDEPAAGMNEEETARLASFLRTIREETGVGILIVEHDLSLVLALCDQIIVLEKGHRIAAGTPQKVAEDPRVIAAYLGRSKVSQSVEHPAA